MKPHRLHYAVVKEQQLYFKYEPVSIAGLKKAYKTHGVIRLQLSGYVISHTQLENGMAGNSSFISALKHI